MWMGMGVVVELLLWRRKGVLAQVGGANQLTGVMYIDHCWAEGVDAAVARASPVCTCSLLGFLFACTY
jgi:hypothetical protein